MNQAIPFYSSLGHFVTVMRRASWSDEENKIKNEAITNGKHLGSVRTGVGYVGLKPTNYSKVQGCMVIPFIVPSCLGY